MVESRARPKASPAKATAWPFPGPGTAGDSGSPRRSANAEEGNHDYQRSLATALVAGLGYDIARETCRGNGWEGVLRVLFREPAAG